MRSLILAAMIVGAAPLAAQSSSVSTITKTELRTDPPARTSRRLRDMMWGLFEDVDLRREAPPRHALDSLYLATHPRGTEIAGLCRFDRVVMAFAPDHRGAHDADTPVRAVGLTARAFFRFLAPPADLHSELADHRRLPGEEACGSSHGPGLHYFAAQDAQTATDGYFAFLRLQDAMRDGSAPGLECELFPADRQDCAEVIRSLRPESIGSIDPCDPAPTPRRCFRLSTGERSIEILMATADGSGEPARRVERARLQSFIIMAHERLD